MRYRFLFILPLFAVFTLLAAPSAHASVRPPDLAISGILVHAPPGYLAPQTAPVIVHAPMLAAVDLHWLADLATPDRIAWALGALLSFLLGLSGVSKWLTANRRKWIGFAAHHAFLIVEDLQSNGVHVSDKAIAGLKAADDWLAANGFRTLSPQEQDAVKLEFSALNGATVVSPSQPAAK